MRETKGKEPSYGQETSRTTISTAKEERYVHGERDQVIHRRGGGRRELTGDESKKVGGLEGLKLVLEFDEGRKTVVDDGGAPRP